VDVIITEPEELFSHELRAVVSDDGVRDPKAIDDVREERYGFLRVDIYYRLSFDSFGELVDSH
jgi:hypothetical protein